MCVFVLSTYSYLAKITIFLMDLSFHCYKVFIDLHKKNGQGRSVLTYVTDDQLKISALV